MPEIPQPNAAAEKDPLPLRTKLFRKFQGVYTKASRSAIPDDFFFDLVNMIPIGDENAHVVNNIGPALNNFGVDNIYWSQGANLNGTEYLFCFGASGAVYQYNIGSQVTTTIAPAATLSGSGSRFDQWQNTAILFIDPVNGLYSWNGTTFAHITGPGVPTAGTDIAVYSNFVWVVNGRQLFVSAINGYTQTFWTAANGAQIVNLIDPQIRGSIQRMKAANGYLYLFAASGINAISNVNIPIGASPPAPTFQNTNIQALIGTSNPASVFAYDRLLMLASGYGTHTLDGLSAPKVSGNIDGTWQYLDTSQVISGGQVVVENILCGAFLLKCLANVSGNIPARTVVALWFQTSDVTQIGATETQDVWWFANFGALTFVTTGIVNNSPALFGFIGNTLYQLFADNTTGPAVIAQTKLWPMEDELARKGAIMAGFEAFFYLTSAVGPTITLDTETRSTVLNTQNVQSGNWVNAAAVQGQWINAALVTGGWVGFAAYLLFADAQGGYGRHMGLTMTATGFRFELHFLALDYKMLDRWF